MGLRIISALVLVPLVLAGVIYATPWLFVIALGIVGTFCLYEYFGLTRSMGLSLQPWFVYLASWTLLIGIHGQWIPTSLLLALVLLAGMLAAMWRRNSMRDRALGLMANLLGVLYPALFLYPAVAVRFEFGERRGLQWLLILLAVIWLGDTFAMIVGKRFGRTPFASRISPKKTNEGALGGLLAGILGAVLLQRFLFQNLPLQHVIALSLLLGIFGQIGDLAESMLKRAAEIKDSSHLIPGHGGVLDRIDSLLFAFPVAYLYLLLLYRP
jgi:phosphatidate cytidylyltransferase